MATAASVSWALLTVTVGAPAQASVTTIGVFTDDVLTEPEDSREETYLAAKDALPDPTTVEADALLVDPEAPTSPDDITGVVDDVDRLADPEPDPGEEPVTGLTATQEADKEAGSPKTSSSREPRSEPTVSPTPDSEARSTEEPTASASAETTPTSGTSTSADPSEKAAAAPEASTSTTSSPSSQTQAESPSPTTEPTSKSKPLTKDSRSAGVESGMTALASTSGSSGEGGDWSATSLAPSATWGTSGATGAFTWSYPFEVPETAGGLVPQLGLSYSSASSDGRVASTNNQTSWVGEGFDLEPGYIERSFVPCDDDRDDKSGSVANNKTHRTGDLCWGVDNATLMLGGSAVALVKDETGKWIPKDIDGTRIEHLNDAPAPDGVPAGLRDATGEYWKVTGVDGTVYYFGRDRAAAEGSALNSAWTVPIYGNHPGEPGHDTSFAASSAQQAWRWNLDYVVDPSGNSMTYFYGSNTAAYGADMGDKVRQYHPGGWLKRIEYGTRHVAGAPDTPTNAPAKVVFEAAAREWSVGEGTNTDVPTSLRCAADATTCSDKVSPVFYTTKQLTGVRTDAYDTAAGAYRAVDEWQLGQSWFNPGDYSLGKGGTGRILRLDGITHVGRGGDGDSADDITLPSVLFGWEPLKNRIDTSSDDAAGMWRPRMTSIRTESGASVSIGYKGGCATKPTGTDPGADGGPGNKRLCFPVKWMSEAGDTENPEPIIDWFQKYVVSSIVASGSSNPADAAILPTGSAPTETHYAYDAPGGAYWAKPVAAITNPKQVTHSEFRGFRWVKTTQGVGTEETSPVKTFYYRGKASQTLTAGAASHQVSVVDDEEARVGDVFASVTFNNGTKVSETVTKTTISAPVATKGDLEATRVTSVSEYGFTYDSAGGLGFRVLATTSFDDYGQPTTISDRGDLATEKDDTCVRMAYAHRDPTAPADLANQRGLVWRTQTLNTSAADVGACPTSTDLDAVTPSDLLSEEVLNFNASGFPIETWAIDPQVATTSTTVGAVKAGSMDGAGRTGMVRTSKTTPDALGRAVSETVHPDDTSVDRTTTTTYTPTGAGLVEQVTTSQGDIDGTAGWRPAFETSKKYDPFLGVVLESEDLNDKITKATYDSLGRLETVRYPQHAGTGEVSLRYTYLDRDNGLNAIKTETLNAHADGYHTSVVLRDGLGREIQTQAESANTGDSYQNRTSAVDTRVLTHTVYNTAGEKKKAYGPWLSVAGRPTDKLLNFKEITEPDRMTSWLYDDAGRVTDEILWSDPSVNGYDEKWRTLTAYNGKATTVTPPEGGIKTTTIVDALGRTVEQRQHNGRDAGSPVQATTYTYDQAGQLVELNDPAGTSWTYEYDFAGRQKKAVDPDAGTTVTSYYADGQPRTVTNGAGEKLAYTYDKLGRPLTLRDDTVDGEIRVEHLYDGEPQVDPDTAGMLGVEHGLIRHTDAGDYSIRTAKVDDAYRPLTTTLSYPQVSEADAGGEGGGPTGDIPEALARLTTESASVDYTYTADGQIASQTTSKVSATDSATILGQERVTTYYDQASKPRWMGGGFGWGTYVADSLYNDLGQLELMDLGNTYSAALSRTYDPTTGRLTGQKLKREAITGHDLDQSYTYADSGNVTSITDAPTNTSLGAATGVGARGEKQCFIYDNLARLTHAWTPAGDCGTEADPGDPALAGPAPYQADYSYDPLNSNRDGQKFRDGLTGVTETTAYDYSQAGNAGPHAVTSVTGTSTAANGTTTTLPARDFTYTGTGGQATRTGTEVTGLPSSRPDVLDVDYTDGTAVDDAQNRAMTVHGSPAVIEDGTVPDLGLAGSKVAKFDGVDDAYSYAMGDAQWDKIDEEVSVACTLKENGTLPNSAQHAVCSAKEAGGMGLYISSGKLTFAVYTDGAYRRAQTEIVSGKWYDAVGTWDGDTVRLYVDGSLVASADAPGPLIRPAGTAREHFFVGADASGTAAGWGFAPASVARMGMYSRALSATEVAAIHAGTFEGTSARRDVDQVMCWDPEGKLTKTLTSGESCDTGAVDELGEAEYVYSGAGERLVRADAESVTIYLPGGQEVTIPRDETKNVSANRYYAFNGETVAVRHERGLGGVTSLVNDHHGTPIVSIPNTTWTQTSVAKHYSDPFGAARGKERMPTVEDRDANGSPGDRGFLGKSNDTTGLTQVGARYYDPTTGSFVSSDPLLDPSEPRHLNAYAYSYQNPTTQSDPTGLKADLIGGGRGGGFSGCSSGCIRPWREVLFGTAKAKPKPKPVVPRAPSSVDRARDAAMADRGRAAAARAEAEQRAAINAAKDQAAASRNAARQVRTKRDRRDEDVEPIYIYRTPKKGEEDYELKNGPNPANHQTGDRKIYFGERSVAGDYVGRPGFSDGMVRYAMHPSFLDEFKAYRYDWQGPGGAPRIEWPIPVERLDEFNAHVMGRRWVNGQ